VFLNPDNSATGWTVSGIAIGLILFWLTVPPWWRRRRNRSRK
jgi:hypothetical protein